MYVLGIAEEILLMDSPEEKGFICSSLRDILHFHRLYRSSKKWQKAWVFDSQP